MSTKNFQRKTKKLKQKQVSIDQSWKIHMNTKVKQWKTKKRIQTAKFDADPSVSRTRSPGRMNKKCNVQGSIKSLHRSYSMDSDTNRIIANFNLENTITTILETI